MLRRVSRAFYFHQKAVEFAAGLAWHPDGKRLIVSFSVQDRESWIATVDADEVRSVLLDVERLPSGAPTDLREGRATLGNRRPTRRLARRPARRQHGIRGS